MVQPTPTAIRVETAQSALAWRREGAARRASPLIPGQERGGAQHRLEPVAVIPARSIRADLETHCVSPPAALQSGKTVAACHSRGQRPARRARSARHGRDGRWPAAFGATGRKVDSASRGEGDGLRQTS